MTDRELTEDWSVPESAILESIGRSLDADELGVLVTIIEVEGNAYRRPGAKMVVADEDGGVGSITAGCLEDDVLDLAASVRADGEMRVKRFDLTGDDDVWGLGLGCNGVIDVLVEPVGEHYRPVVDRYEEGEDTVIATVVKSDVSDVTTGDRMVLPDGDFSSLAAVAGEWPAWVTDELADPVGTFLEKGQSDTVEVTSDGDEVSVFIDVVDAPPELLVFGTGHDVRPVVEFARKLDYRVTVVGFRGGLATDDRFPEADRVISTSPAQFRDHVDVDGETYAVVMTHNFLDDTIVIGELLETPTPYVGLMGPDERFEELLADVESDRGPLSDDELDRIYSPIGLDLGGGAPYEIAMSVVGEVQAVANNRDPKHLRARKSPIHERVEVEP